MNRAKMMSLLFLLLFAQHPKLPTWCHMLGDQLGSVSANKVLRPSLTKYLTLILPGHCLSVSHPCIPVHAHHLTCLRCPVKPRQSQPQRPSDQKLSLQQHTQAKLLPSCIHAHPSGSCFIPLTSLPVPASIALPFPPTLQSPRTPCMPPRSLLSVDQHHTRCLQDKVNMSVAILPMSQQFGWSASVAGLVQSSFFWGYMLSQVPAGYLANKYSGRWLLPGGVGIWSGFTAAVPLLTSTVRPSASRIAAPPPPPPPASSHNRAFPPHFRGSFSC